MTHMEVYQDGVRCHAALAKATEELARVRAAQDQSYADAIASLVASTKMIGKLTKERDAALAMLDCVERVCDNAEVFGYEVAAADLRLALKEPTG